MKFIRPEQPERRRDMGLHSHSFHDRIFYDDDEAVIRCITLRKYNNRRRYIKKDKKYDDNYMYELG